MKRRSYKSTGLICLILGICLVSFLFTGKIRQYRTQAAVLHTVSLAEAPPEMPEMYRISGVPLLCQYPALPTGCESASAAMLLQYHGLSVTPEDFAASWLETHDFYRQYRVLFGPDPHEVFAGDPFSRYGCGCFAGAVIRAVNRQDCGVEAAAVTVDSLSGLCPYLCSDTPVLVWATLDMQPVRPGDRWILPDGSPFTWPSGEHCLVLTGYDSEYFYMNDPAAGVCKAYRREAAEARFQELGCQAVIFLPAPAN